MGTRLHIVVSEELVARVDEARGLVPRSAWLRAAVEQALSEAKEPPMHEQADSGSVPSSEGVWSAAPAEQPSQLDAPSVDRMIGRLEGEGVLAPAEQLRAEAERYRPALEELAKSDGPRSSVQAKRDVRPVPKAGEK